MVQVVIQPSFGNPEARHNWSQTIQIEVPFYRSPYRATLSEQEFEGLSRLHPAGVARFWGVVSGHDARMDTLETGDVVLFTGKKHVQGVGEVGVSFRNREMADAMWPSHPDKGSYHNVYSLRGFQPVAIPYEEIWALPGFTHGDNFMGTRFVTDERVDVLMEGLGIHPTTSDVREADAEAALARELSRSSTTRVIPGEAYNVTSTTYQSAARTILVRRSESLLVSRYAENLGIVPERTSTPVGLTDLYILAERDGHELVEAKSGTTRRHVREAVGQLLDYATHCRDVTSLAVLHPERPDHKTLNYAHRYGIDVIYRTPSGSFDRARAPEQARSAILRLASTAPARA